MRTSPSEQPLAQERGARSGSVLAPGLVRRKALPEDAASPGLSLVFQAPLHPCRSTWGTRLELILCTSGGTLTPAWGSLPNASPGTRSRPGAGWSEVLGFWIPAHVAQVSCTTPCGDLFTSVFSGAASGGSNPRMSPSSPKGDTSEPHVGRLN